MRDRLDECRSESIKKVLRRLKQTPKHLQDMKRPAVVDWVRENCDPRRIAELAIEIDGTIDSKVLSQRRGNDVET